MLKLLNSITMDRLNATRRVSDIRLTTIAQSAIVGLLFLFLYGPVIRGMVADWYTYDIYSYGFLVPLISAYLIWRNRAQLLMIPLAPSLWGCILLTAAVMIFLIGQLMGEPYAMRVSSVVALIALTQILFGYQIVKASAFPLLYLFLMIPFPYVLGKEIRDVLMFFDASQSANLSQILGIPIYADSNFLYLPNITLEVAEVCSGLASIFALFALGCVLGYILQVPAMIRVLLAVIAVPLAIFVNLIRIVITIVLVYWFGPVVLGSAFHMFTGTFNFLLSVAVFLAIGENLRKRFQTAGGQEALTVEHHPSQKNYRSGWIEAVAASIILLAATGLTTLLTGDRNTVSAAESIQLPQSLGAYTSNQIAWPDPYRDANADITLSRTYSDKNGIPIEFFVGYRANGQDGRRLQSPRLIFPGHWGYVWDKSTTIEIGESTTPVEADWLMLQQGGTKQLVLYWYRAGGNNFSGEMGYRFAILKERLLHGKSDIAVVRLATPIVANESLDRAQTRLRQFAVGVYPELVKVLPR